MIPLFVQEVDLGTELCELLWKENYAKDINCELQIYKFIKKKRKGEKQNREMDRLCLDLYKVKSSDKIQ